MCGIFLYFWLIIKLIFNNKTRHSVMRFCLCLRYEIAGCDIVWAVKDEFISHTFIDKGAAAFLLQHLGEDKPLDLGPMKRHKYTHDDCTGEGKGS